MPNYRIYAGLSGGFGGASFQYIEEYENEEQAEDNAYILACEQYDSYGGMHGLFNSEDALDEDPDLTEGELNEMESEDRESWIDYKVELCKDGVEYDEEGDEIDPDA